MSKNGVDLPQYPQFGRLFTLALTRNKLGPKALLSSDTNQIVRDYFCREDKKDYPKYYKSYFYKWSKGYLNDPQHPLIMDVLRDIILEDLGKPGLNNIDSISLLLSNGRPEYMQILSDPEFIEKTLRLKKEGKIQQIKDVTNPVPFYVPTLTDEIINRDIESDITKHLKRKSRLFISGEMGIGKSTIIRKLAYTKFIIEYDQIIWLDLSTNESFTQSILSSLEHYFPIESINLRQDHISSIKRLIAKLTNQKCIFLLENCKNLSPLQDILSIIPNNMYCLAEIIHSEVASLLDITGKNTILIPTFNQAELEWFHDELVPQIPVDEFSTISSLVKNNPHELTLACGKHKEFGYQWTIQNINNGVDKTIIEKSIDNLEDNLKVNYYLLGNLPELRSYELEVFTSLWKCEPFSAIRILKKFTNLKLINQLALENHWTINSNARESINGQSNPNPTINDDWIVGLDLPKRYRNMLLDVPNPNIIDFVKSKLNEPETYVHSFSRVIRQMINPEEHSTYWHLINASSQYLTSEDWLLAKYEDMENRKFFNTMRVILGTSLIFLVASIIFSLVIHKEAISIPLEIIWLFPIAFLVALFGYILNPSLRKQEYYSLQLLKKFRQ